MMTISEAKEVIKKGMRLRLLSPIDDPYTPKSPGDILTVTWVDDRGQIHGHWKSGGSIAIICDQDEFEIMEG